MCLQHAHLLCVGMAEVMNSNTDEDDSDDEDTATTCLSDRLLFV